MNTTTLLSIEKFIDMGLAASVVAIVFVLGAVIVWLMFDCIKDVRNYNKQKK